MRRTRAKILFAVLAALLLAAGCKSGDDDDEDELPAVQYKVLGGRLVWCSGGADELAVPDNASSIGNNAFNNCGHIKTLTIPASVTYIMSGTFSRVEIDTIYFGGTYDDWDAMVDGFGFTLGSTPVKCADDRIWIWTASAVPDVPVNPDDCEITEDGVLARYTGSAADVRIPDGVTAIGAGAFEGCADITHVTIPGGVTSIGENAFKDCAGLTDIEIPDGVAAIGENAFAGCDSLASVDIPASVEAIGAGAIPAETTVIFCGTAERWDELAANAGLDGLTVFIIDENGTLTGYRGSAADIVIPDSVTAIGDGAFSGCAGLTGVTIPAGVTDIGADAFKDCAALTDVTIPGGVTNIGDGAFSGCAGLTDVTIPAGVTDIGADAFKNCTGLTDIAIPASVEHIGDGAFDGCTSLMDITYGGTMEQLKELTKDSGIDLSAVNVDISSWVIRDGVLVGYCGSETDITIPGGVTAIGDGAFSGCTELTNIAIPASVTTIGADALACGNLDTITFAGTVADWDVLAEASGIADELGGVTVVCSDGLWTPAHKHTWGEEYTDGRDGMHYQVCSECGEVSGPMEHRYGNVSYDADGHYKTCVDCGRTEKTASHTWRNYADDGNGKHSKRCEIKGCEVHTEHEAHDYEYGNNADGSHYQTCKAECGYSEDVDHNWSAWRDDGNGNHSRICEIEGFEAHSTTEEHTYDDDADTECDICGYRKEIPGVPDCEHTFAVKHTENGHYRKCSLCGEEVGFENHQYDGEPYESNGADGHSRTCTAAGCGYVETEGHSLVECESDGAGGHQKTCKAGCGYSEDVDHNWSAWRDDGDGNHSRICEIEGFEAHSATEEHTYDDDRCKVCECPRPPTVYVASTGSDDNPGSRSKPFATIQKAVDTVIAMNDGASAYTIYVDGTLTQSAAASTDGMADFSALAKNLTLTIKALSGTATLDANQKSRVINAAPASGKLNLTLENLTVTGGNTTGNGGGMYFGSAGGTLTISDGTTIKGNTASVNGGGLYVNAGTFTMTGGTISECTATTQGGGVCIKSGGTFEMSGTAKITGCKMTSTAGGTGGGGIYNSGTLTIIGGTISGNTASSYGGGICVYDNGTFTMTGGTISGNTASASGGGVYVSGGLSTSGIFAMTGDTTISGNTAGNDGGGVCVYNGTFTMDGGTISKNKANGSSEVFGGGGIYLYRATTSMPGGRFTLKGGTVSGNEADYGGGIWAGGSSEYAMEGGSVSENKATYGGGAYIYPGCTFKMSGAAQFAADNDVYLKQSETIPTIITVAGALTAASPVATITPSAYTAGTQVLSGAATTLAANCGKFEVSEAGWKIDGEGKLAVAPDIYVSEDGDNTNGKGSQAKPFAKLQKAFDLIQTLNLSTVSYTVHISGAVKGKSELSADVSAQKISITGTTGAKLDGNKCLSWLLTISCSAPVEITNVTLTNSWNGGLYVKSGADVTLGEGAAISKNSNILSGGRGGGVRNEGKFTMKSNAKISENDMTGDRDPGGGVYSNGTFIMEGGEISGNYTSTNYSTGYGGGVCIADGTFEMSGGTISGNRASSASRGGGVYVGSGTFTMTGGTISGNTASEGNGVCAYKSFNMSGAAKIAEDNDVYLANDSAIRIADNLTAQSPVATITLSDSVYTAGRQVLSAGTGVTITQGICDKFAVTPQADGTKWKIAPSSGNGVLEKDTVSTGGGGISVTIPDLGTYTFKVVSGGTEIVDGSTLPQGATITLSEVRKDGVALTASDGTFLIELTDGVYSFESKGFSGTSATGLPSTISLPPLPPAPIPLLVYIKAEFANSIVIEKDIEVLVVP